MLALPIKTFFAIVGLACLALAFWLFARRVRAVRSGAVAVGSVAGHELRESDGTQCFLPIVVFHDASDREHRFTSVAGGSSRLPAIGTPVRVRYNPSEPGQAYISTFLHLWAGPVALAVLGFAGMATLWVS